MLKLELADLKALGADLSTLGFDARELAAAFEQGSGGLTDENEIPSCSRPLRPRRAISGALGRTASPVVIPRTRAL